MRSWTECMLMLPRITVRIVVVFIAVMAFFPVTTKAQQARDFLNAPANTFSAYVDFVFTRGQSAPSADVSLPNDLTLSRLISPNVLYHSSFHKRYAGVAVAFPYTRVKDANGNEKTSGFTDPSITFHMNIFGLPSLTKEEIATATPQTFLTAHLTVTPPLGSYDRNSPVNTGSNRWSFTPLFNLDITRDKGVSWIDLYGRVTFFTDNNEFRGSHKLSQKPLLVLTGHYSHNIGKRFWASIGVNYDYGGESSINNVRQNNPANGFRPAASFSTKIGKRRITLTYENTATKVQDAPRNGLLRLRFSTPLF
jgi:hypothetical protein